MSEVAQLTKGKSFGDMALLDYKPRSATVKCITNWKFAVIVKEDYNKIFGKIQRKKINKQIELIRTIPYFEDWSNKEVKHILQCIDTVDYKRNNLVFNQGDTSKYIYIINEGEFELLKLVNFSNKEKWTTVKINGEKLQTGTQNSNSKMKYQLIKFRHLGPGNLLGDLDALLDRPYRFRVRIQPFNQHRSTLSQLKGVDSELKSLDLSRSEMQSILQWYL